MPLSDHALARLELLARPPRDQPEQHRQHPYHDAVDPDLGHVAEPEGDVDPVGGSGEEDEEDPADHPDPDPGADGRVARPVKKVVEGFVAGEAALAPRPDAEDAED